MAGRLLSFEYLSPNQLAGFEKYKYRSVDTSPFATYVMHPFWNKFVKIYPLWLSPNILTFLGWLLTLGNFLALAFIDWDFTAANYYSDISNVPRWVWLALGLSQFLSHTLDGTDGKQARRTHSSSPLGELFDHGLDSLAVFLMTMSLYTLVGSGLKIDEFFIALCVILLGFYLAHWEKYNTSVLFLPWAYDFSQVVIAGAYVATCLFGPDMWKAPVFGEWRINNIFKITVHFSLWGMGFPVSIWHIIRARWKHPESCPSLHEGMIPIISVLSLFGTFSLWAWFSPTNIYFKHPRVFCFALGIIFSNITCRLIVAQMSSTLCERFNRLYLLLIVTVLLAFSGMINESGTLHVFTLVAMIAHIHYGICVLKKKNEIQNEIQNELENSDKDFTDEKKSPIWWNVRRRRSSRRRKPRRPVPTRRWG